MNKIASKIPARFMFVLMLVSVVSFLSINNLCAEDPDIEDPCEIRGTAKEDAARYVQDYTYLDNEIRDGKEVIASINAGEFTDMELLARIIDMSLFSWSCDNGFLKRNDQTGYYFFRENAETGQGIFLGIRGGGYVPSSGVNRGRASFDLYEYGPFMDMHSLMVTITDLNADSNEKPITRLDDEAQKIIEEIIDYSYKWGMEYYTELIELADKKQ